jgi:osmotically inducible protein OsmC
MKINRKGSASWSGGIKDGKGTISSESGALTKHPYGYAMRFEGVKGTNPEELIGAAHAGCFSMFLSLKLTEAGFPPVSVDTTANVHLERVDGAQTVTRIELDTTAVVPGIDVAEFGKLAEVSKEGCPISRLLAPGTQISLTATLAS